MAQNGALVRLLTIRNGTIINALMPKGQSIMRRVYHAHTHAHLSAVFLNPPHRHGFASFRGRYGPGVILADPSMTLRDRAKIGQLARYEMFVPLSLSGHAAYMRAPRSRLVPGQTKQTNHKPRPLSHTEPSERLLFTHSNSRN